MGVAFLFCKLCIVAEHSVVYYHFAHRVNAWKTSGHSTVESASNITVLNIL